MKPVFKRILTLLAWAVGLLVTAAFVYVVLGLAGYQVKRWILERESRGAPGDRTDASIWKTPGGELYVITFPQGETSPDLEGLRRWGEGEQTLAYVSWGEGVVPAQWSGIGDHPGASRTCTVFPIEDYVYPGREEADYTDFLSGWGQRRGKALFEFTLDGGEGTLALTREDWTREGYDALMDTLTVVGEWTESE